jgi:sugar phosphate permease
MCCAGVVGQLGSAVAGGVLGWVLEKYGWQMFVPVLGTAAAACLGLIIIYSILNTPEKQPHLE